MNFLILDIDGNIIGHVNIGSIEELKYVWHDFGEHPLIIDFEEKQITIYSDWIE